MSGHRDVEFWRMGFTPAPIAEVGRWARRFEEAGWDGFAVGGEGGQSDPYATLTLVATSTERLQVGTAVVVPSRHPLHAANAMATVHAISGGRSRFGIGRGDGAYALIGERPPGVSEFERYLRRVQGYLRGEDVELDNGFCSRMLKGPMFESAAGGKAPVDVACTGPRMIRLGAQLGDSVSFSVGADERRLAGCIELAREARREAGLDAETLSLGAYVQVAVAEGGEIDAAREMLHSLVVIHAHFSAYRGHVLTDADPRDRVPMLAAARSESEHIEETWRGNPGSRYSSRNVVDADFIDRFAIVGPPDHCAERIARLADLGLDRIYIGTRNGVTDLDERNTIRIGEEVFPLVRG